MPTTRPPSQPSRAPSLPTCRRRRSARGAAGRVEAPPGRRRCAQGADFGGSIRQRPEAPGHRQRARRRHGRSTLPRSGLLGRSRRAGRAALRPRRSAPRPVHGAPRGRFWAIVPGWADQVGGYETGSSTCAPIGQSAGGCITAGPRAGSIPYNTEGAAAALTTAAPKTLGGRFVSIR